MRAIKKKPTFLVKRRKISSFKEYENRFLDTPKKCTAEFYVKRSEHGCMSIFRNKGNKFNILGMLMLTCEFAAICYLSL